MATHFAAIEARVNAAVVAHLANATADFGGDVVVSALFDAPSRDAFGLVADTAPALTLTTADAASAVVNGAVTVAGSAYTIARIEPGGTGMTRLTLKT